MRLFNVRASTAPAGLPFTVSEVKDHLRVVHSDEDSLIGTYLRAAVNMAETISKRALVTRTYTGQLSHWPHDAEIILPYPPLQSVTSITYTDEDNVTATWNATNYVVDTHKEPGRIYFARNYTLPGVNLQRGGAIEVTFKAGFTTVPDEYKQAIFLLVGHYYENREAVIAVQGITMGTLPMAVNNLLRADEGYI